MVTPWDQWIREKIGSGWISRGPRCHAPRAPPAPAEPVSSTSLLDDGARVGGREQFEAKETLGRRGQGARWHAGDRRRRVRSASLLLRAHWSSVISRGRMKPGAATSPPSRTSRNRAAGIARPGLMTHSYLGRRHADIVPGAADGSTTSQPARSRHWPASHRRTGRNRHSGSDTHRSRRIPGPASVCQLCPPSAITAW